MRSQLLFAWNHWNILQLRLFIQPKFHKLARTCFWHCFWTLQHFKGKTLHHPMHVDVTCRSQGKTCCTSGTLAALRVSWCNRMHLIRQYPTHLAMAVYMILYAPLCHFVPCASLCQLIFSEDFRMRIFPEWSWRKCTSPGQGLCLMLSCWGSGLIFDQCCAGWFCFLKMPLLSDIP